MTPNEYQILIKRTDYDENTICRLLGRLMNEQTSKLVHYALGITGEAGELADAVKKCIRDGQDIDRVNMIEEIGDCLWYLGNMLNALGSTFEDAMEKNIAKLSVRYPDGFTESGSSNRAIEKERKVLE